MVRQETVAVRFPAITAAFASVSLIVYFWPHLADLFVYDRQAVLEGEVWRLVTAPFVHFSPSHIFWDLLVFVAAGWRIETAGYRRFFLVCSLAAVIPGPVFLLVSTELARYGGLSGLATGAVVYLALSEVKGTVGSDVLWPVILALTGLKVIVESVAGTPIFTSAASAPFRVLPFVHVVGIVTALAVFLWTRPDTAFRCSGAAPVNTGIGRK